MQHLTKNRMNSRKLVFQTGLKLVDNELAILLFLDQAVGDLPLPRGDRAIMLDPPYREAAHDQIDHCKRQPCKVHRAVPEIDGDARSEEHTSELQSQSNLVCRLLLEKKKKNNHNPH